MVSVSFFKNHFKRVSIRRPGLSQDFAYKKVAEVDNEFLVAPFLESEIREAVWSCDGSKSPGPDGFNFAFIRETWETTKLDILRMMNEFHDNGRFVKGFNPSFLVLVLKKEASVGLGDYRPISLIGGIYKIISKVLAKRLGCVLESIISENRSAFVGGRQILDSIIILNEAIDEAKKARMERIFFKIDFAKAYAMIDWGYLDMIMDCFGFHAKWRKWMRECVTTASTSVLVNGSPIDDFCLERGLRQGDPLSPFLFLIAAEGLNILMKKATDCGSFIPAEIRRDRV